MASPELDEAAPTGTIRLLALTGTPAGTVVVTGTVVVVGTVGDEAPDDTTTGSGTAAARKSR
jgi:hypothetical protein